MNNEFIKRKELETTLLTLFKMARIADASLQIDKEQKDEVQTKLNEELKKKLVDGASAAFGMYCGLFPNGLNEDQEKFMINLFEKKQKDSYTWIKTKIGQ